MITPEQYLELERKAEARSEYYNGEILPMAPSPDCHAVVNGNLIGLLGQQLRYRPCFVYGINMRLCVSATGLYTYPDVTVACGDERFLDGPTATLLNPTVIIEVLSRSTEAYDRGRTFEHYRSIESLREYLMLGSERMHADLFTRQPDGRWLLTAISRAEDIVELESIGCKLVLAEVYEKVDLS